VDLVVGAPARRPRDLTELPPEQRRLRLSPRRPAGLPLLRRRLLRLLLRLRRRRFRCHYRRRLPLHLRRAAAPPPAAARLGRAVLTACEDARAGRRRPRREVEPTEELRPGLRPAARRRPQRRGAGKHRAAPESELERRPRCLVGRRLGLARRGPEAVAAALPAPENVEKGL
jgi:hypothetical protein